MVDLKLPIEVLEVLRQKAQALKSELEGANQKKDEIEREIEDMQTKLRSIESLIREPSTDVNKDETAIGYRQQELTINIANLPLGQAALEVLKSEGKSMKAIEILEALQKRGRAMSSPHSRDMITMALKRMKDKIEIRRRGNTNRYKAK